MEFNAMIIKLLKKDSEARSRKLGELTFTLDFSAPLSLIFLLTLGPQTSARIRSFLSTRSVVSSNGYRTLLFCVEFSTRLIPQEGKLPGHAASRFFCLLVRRSSHVLLRLDSPPSSRRSSTRFETCRKRRASGSKKRSCLSTACPPSFGPRHLQLTLLSTLQLSPSVSRLVHRKFPRAFGLAPSSPRLLSYSRGHLDGRFRPWVSSLPSLSRSKASADHDPRDDRLGDRHCENILLDGTTGDTVHVDFNCLFDKVRHLLPFLVYRHSCDTPRRVELSRWPRKFLSASRQTSSMAWELLVSKVRTLTLSRCCLAHTLSSNHSGVYRRSAEIALRILRANKDSLRSVLETFLHDPLVEWISRKVSPPGPAAVRC